MLSNTSTHFSSSLGQYQSTLDDEEVTLGGEIAYLSLQTTGLRALALDLVRIPLPEGLAAWRVRASLKFDGKISLPLDNPQH